MKPYETGGEQEKEQLQDETKLYYYIILWGSPDITNVHNFVHFTFW